MINEKDPGCLGYTGDYTTQLLGDYYNKTILIDQCLWYYFMSEQLAWCRSLTQPSTDLSTASWWSIHQVTCELMIGTISCLVGYGRTVPWRVYPWNPKLSEAMGNRQTDIRSGVLKQRLKPDGTAVGEVLKNVPWQCWPDSTLCFLFGDSLVFA